EAFSQKFEEVVSTSIDPLMLIPELIIDAEITFKKITPGFYNIVQQMEPYGPENLRPVFITKNVMSTPWTKIVKEKHIRFVVKNENITMTGIGFNLADKFNLLQMNKPLDIVFTIDENEWNNTVNFQLKVVDFRLSDVAN
ncbi:MAG TPA: single-stranded-DNA-specific exonuclease RecJ, partial [Hanamia sp.]|nr:single-stranded-DNA-specific exonuclease RecJ [Hanamia sp.]